MITRKKFRDVKLSLGNISQVITADLRRSALFLPIDPAGLTNFETALRHCRNPINKDNRA